MGANTRYKDSVFSFLFNNPDILRELYCALEDVTLPSDIPVTINTLQDVLFMDRVNDISFEIGGKLVILIEHQSTINPNMALRLLMYIARVYEKIVGDKNIYKSQMIRLPRPEFFVLYNGKAPCPDKEEFRLSDAFEKTGLNGILEKGTPTLELVVKVININQGRNEGIARKCRTLAEYSAFVEKVREHQKECGILEEAIKKAIIFCREHDILKEFLEKNATEVINMLMTEWNWDDALAVRFEEGLEKGLEKGLEEGLEEGLEKGRETEREEIARNAITKGLSIEVIHEITGLDMATISKLQEAVNNGASDKCNDNSF